jgi:hypothetical protein
MSLVNWILILMIPGLIAYPIIIDREDRKRFSLNSSRDPYWKYLIRTLLFSIVWPLLGLLILIDKFVSRLPISRRKSVKEAVDEMKSLINGESWDDGKLRFQNMGGKGNLNCQNCFHTEEVVSFLHGFGADPWTNNGYQCQNCGKFYAIEYDRKLAKLPSCDCGGELSRDKPIFCPKCISFKVNYHCTLMT